MNPLAAGILGNFQEAMSIVFGPRMLLIITAVAVIGVILGALPGVGPALAMALFFPFTFVLPAEQGLVIMAVLYGTTAYGGSISAILINVPGTGGSAATLIDGFPMTQRGEGTKAVGISTFSSFTGAVVGLILLALFAPILSRWALQLGPPQIFLLAVLGLCCVSAVSGESVMKSLAAMSLGVFFASVGLDPIRARPRFTFDWLYLQNGVDLIVMLIGVFAISQALKFVLEGDEDVEGSENLGGSALDGFKSVMSDKVGALRGSLIGTIVGAIPGAGMSTANFLSYIITINLSKNPEEFGTGKEEGIIAAETANNGSTMGALIPAMTLAIPGGAAAAVFIGVMFSYGITPGIQAFQGPLPYVVFTSIFLGDLVFLVFGLFAAKYIAKVIQLPRDVLLSGIVVFALVGSFAMRNNVLDIGAAILFGVLGFALSRRGYSLIAFILGFILAPIAEQGYQRAILISSGDYGIFVDSVLNVALILTAIALLLSPIVFRIYRERDAEVPA